MLQGGAGTHEDEIMHGVLDEIMAQEEAAEQDVLAQLRQRAASLERDLLQRSLDSTAPTSKVHCNNAELCSFADMVACLGATVQAAAPAV